MNCFFHDNKPAVVACAKCGVGLCRDCMNNTAYTYDDKPLCLNCSKPIAQEELNEAQSNGTWSLVKFLFSGFFIGIGLIALTSGAELIHVWGISGVAGIPAAFKATRRSREQRVMDDFEDRYKKDITDLLFGWALRLLLKLIFIIALAPICAIYTCISNLITFLNSKKKIKEAQDALDYIDQCANEDAHASAEPLPQRETETTAFAFAPLQPEAPIQEPTSSQSQSNTTNTQSTEIFQNIPTTTPSYQAPIQAKQNHSNTVSIIAVVVLLLIGFIAGYIIWYLPYSVDRDAPRFYTFTNLNLRSSEIGDVEYNLIKTLPYGSELITYSKGDEWSSVKADGSKGFVSSPLLLSSEDFHLLNSSWGNTDAKECVFTAKCRLAILDYYKHANLQGGAEWQIYTKKKDDKSNTVYYPRLFNKNSKFTDFLFIVKNNQTHKRMLAFYSFHDETETPIFRHDIEVPQEGYITGVTSYWTQNGLQTSIAFSNGEIKSTLIKVE